MLKTSLILFLVYCTAAYGKVRPGYEDYIFEESLDGFLKLHDKPSTWKVAVETCVSEEAILVDAQDQEIDESLIKVVKDSGKSIEFLFVGSQVFSAPVPEEFVVAGGTQQCVAIYANNATKTTVPCTEEHPFICYAPNIEEEEEEIVEIADCDFKEAGQNREYWPEYNSCKKIGGWVKIHHDVEDHESAKATCEKEGSKILDLNDPKMKEVAMELMKANSSSDVPLIVYGKTKVTHPNGGFTIVDGKRKHVEYLPDYCAVMYMNGTLDKKASCNNTAAVICFAEFPVDSCDGGDLREGHPDYKSCSNITGWVKVHPEPKDYDEAKKTCESEGAQLFDSKDPDFENIAWELVRRNSAIDPLVIFGKNKTVEGEQEFCSVLYPNGTLEPKADCANKLSFICYVPYPITYDCDAEGYQVVNSTELCYKLTTIGKNWNDSRTQCKADGGDLAVIKDAEEAELLKDIYAKHDSIFEGYFPLQVFVGVLEEALGSWKTIDGETLAEAGYDKWAAGKPDNKLSDTPPQVKGIRKTCGCINMQAQLVDCWCDLPQNYMCKKVANKYRLGKKIN